jgi:hypothetical protein
MRTVLPIVVHCVAGTAAVYTMQAHPWAWLWLGIVVLSAVSDGRNIWREFGRPHTLTIAGRFVSIDGVDARVERGWLGPGWTVIRVRLPNRRRRLVSLWRGECSGADHAALRRDLMELDWR